MQMASVYMKREAGAMQDEIIRTRAVLSNNTPSQMTLDRSINWSGAPTTIHFPGDGPSTIVGAFPPSIGPRRLVVFNHGGEPESMAAVQYSGSNSSSVKCAWLLAWKSPPRNTSPIAPSKVYVICGVKPLIDAMSWDQILLHLDSATIEGTCTDPASKTTVGAVITDLGPDQFAYIDANFELIP